MVVNLNNISTRILVRLRENVLPLLLLLLLTVATYWEITTHSILANWDDHLYIIHNPAIRGFSMENLKAAFTSYYVGNYAPVQIISYMFDYALWGDNHLGYFLANVSYHLLSAVLLYFLLLRFGFWRWGAFLGTAVFLVHPVQVESVAWLSQRKNLLAMLLYLLSFHAYLSYRESDAHVSRRWYYLLSLAAFVVALLAKSVAVIFPVMLVMYDQLVPPLRRNITAHLDKIPFMIAAVSVAVIAMISQDPANDGGRIDYPPNAWVVLPLTMLTVLVRYLNLLVCPLPSLQSIMYFPPLRSELDPIVIISLCIVGSLIAVGLYLYRENRPCLFWFGLFFLGLIPVSQVVPLATMMNDRYLYFPMLGVAGLIALFSDFVRDRFGGAIWGKGALVISACIILTLSFTSYQRGKVWKSSITLFSDAVAKYPNQTSTRSRLAEGYVASGDLLLAKSNYEKAAILGELDADARHNLARIYLLTGEYNKAYGHISWLLLHGDENSVNQRLLGEYYYRIGSYPEAEHYTGSYLDTYPADPYALYLLGRIYFVTGDLGLAREAFGRAAKEEGASADLFYSIACLEALEGHSEQSLAAMETAFAKGTINLHEDERCLSILKNDPRIAELLRQNPGE